MSGLLSSSYRGAGDPRCTFQFKGGGTSAVDRETGKEGTPQEILKKLGDNFDDGVVDALVGLGIESLQEFRSFWASEQHRDLDR